MKVLLTNDDGIDAVGLKTLEQAVSDLEGVTEIWVAAPRRPQSGVSHQVNTDRPIAVEPRGERRFAIDGTPADCVRLAVTTLATHGKDANFDWVLAGINDGGNLGVDIHMSGTVAAAREAAQMEIPAIAFSQYVERPEPTDWEMAAAMVRGVWQRLQQHGLPHRSFWNVNFPHRPQSVPAIRLCPPESQPLRVAYQCKESGYIFQSNYAQRPRTSGKDVAICFGGAIALSKLAAGW